MEQTGRSSVRIFLIVGSDAWPNVQPKSIGIETVCRHMHGKRRTKEGTFHGNCPRTVGRPVPFHQPAAIWVDTCLMANLPSGERTNAPADPRTRDTSIRNICRAAIPAPVPP